MSIDGLMLFLGVVLWAIFVLLSPGFLDSTFTNCFQRVAPERVFLWCMISWFYFPWNVNLRNYSSWLVTWKFCATYEEPELLFYMIDFETQVLWMVRVIYWGWPRHAICNMEPWLSLKQFFFLHTLSSVRKGYWNEYLTNSFSWFRKEKNFCLWSVKHAIDPPCSAL